MSRFILVCSLILGLPLRAWLDYDDKVEPRKAVFGKPFQGFALRLSSPVVDFEQDSGVVLQIALQNSGDESALPPATVDRHTHALIIIVADKEGATRVSQNLLTDFPANPVSAGKLKPKATSDILQVSFDDLQLTPFKDYENGLPHSDPGSPRLPASSLTPKVYTIRAILYAAEPDKRPDFAVASDTWSILLRAKSGSRMTTPERKAKMDRWLRKMSEGAYGGIGVSSQLAALGEEAVDPLIALAEKNETNGSSEAEKQAIRESRIWAIVTLCNTGSRRAEDYILSKLRDPVDFGDLSFLAWHSQGFHSERVTAALRQFAEDAAGSRPMPWEERRGPGTRGHGSAALEFVLKHFLSIGVSISDATMEGLVKRGDAKLTSFGLMTWQPSSVDTAVHAVLPLVTGGVVHGNLKRAILASLTRVGPPDGLPVYDRDADVNMQWLRLCLWLRHHNQLSAEKAAMALRWLALDLPRDQDDTQAACIGALQAFGLPDYPVKTERPHLPDDWVATWRWALHTSGIGRDDAIGYCTRMMRTRDELPEAVKEGLLLELRQQIGPMFPLPEARPVDVDTAWPECGGWLVRKGYFGSKDE